MTLALGKLDVPTRVAARYRAKDIEMAATVDVGNRLILITGAIDTNDHDILVRLELPSAGRWQVVKAETNLTDRSWLAWQITFGEGTKLAVDDAAHNLCRQFPSLYVAEDRERLCFYGGEIRPGEAVLKMFTVDAAISRIVMAHNRPTTFDEDDGGGLIDIPEMPLPSSEPDPLPPSTSPIPETPSSRALRAGFPAKPFVETFLPVTRING
jgi:hypothetical protein